MRGVVLGLIALICLPDRAIGGPVLPAPYQVEGVMQFRDDHHRLGEGLAMAPPLVAVTLGRSDGAPNPDREALREVTIIGSEGLARATLYDIRTVCEYLCGDESEECHYEALYALDGPAGAVGTPLAAFPGGAERLSLTPVETPGGTGPAPVLRLSGDDPAPLAWSSDGTDGPQVRVTGWDSSQGHLRMDIFWPSGGSFPVEASGCRAREAGELTELQCNGVAMILADGVPLLLSYPDYNAASAEPVARLRADGMAAYLVRLGLKAQTVFGLLYRDGARWQGRFRPRDYALLC